MLAPGAGRTGFDACREAARRLDLGALAPASLLAIMTATPLDKLIDRSGALYTLPSVAMEVVRLTSDESGDPRALKETIEGDPALTAKLLRVVNSSLFGLSGQVGNLTQAIALLGAQPLKLLVLGFSLPDRLFAELAGDALQRYWTTALTRAVAARGIAQNWFADKSLSGDDAFIAGLLRDIGSLVLIQELGESYLTFLSKTEGVQDRLALEKESLGFDRLELTEQLLSSWKLPAPLINAIAEPTAPSAPEDLSVVVQLADLLAQLVCENRIAALAELLKRGEQSCGLTKSMVNDLVADLQPRVDSLAEAMQVPLSQGEDYTQILFNAHAQMAVVSETAIGMQARSSSVSDDQLSEELLAETHELRLAMRSFLSGKAEGQYTRTEGPHPTARESSDRELNAAARRRLEVAVEKLSTRCREEHTDLSLAVLTIGDWWIDQLERVDDRQLQRALDEAEQGLINGRAARLTLGGPLLAVLLPAVDRRGAIEFCHDFAQRIQQTEGTDSPSPVVHVGLASIAAVPHRFEPATLIDGAMRCLSSAAAAAGDAVKSIEVY